MADLNKELQRIEQGEAWDESDEVVQVEVKKPLDKVVPVRLPAADWAKLRVEARKLGIGPTTLARMWILERLRLQSFSSLDAFKAFELFARSAFLPRLTSALTPKEMEILEYIAQGYLNKQVAEKLGISEETVERTIIEILRKLNAENPRVTYEESKHKA
jgi:DNA-binding CsgD family transcriptional regulator